MKGSEKKVSFSSPPYKSFASPKGSDENDRSNQQTVKNFMSPTVCAASKVSFPRKKILGERNESPGSNSTNTYLSKSPNLDSKPSPKIISKSKASFKNSPNLNPKITCKDPSYQETPSSYNSRDGTPSPSPYDPLTNYLSPRPQFLRYNPDRRKEIFLRLEMKDDDQDDEADTVSSEKSSLASSSSCEDEESSDESESHLEQEDEEFDSGSEEEGEDEEGSWSLRGVLKYFILSVVLVLNTSYIFSVNAPRPSPSPTLGFQNLSMAEGFEAVYNFLDGKQENLGLLSFTQAIADEVIDEQMTENANMGQIVSLEIEDRIVEDECEEELIMIEEASEEFAENIELQEIEETKELIEDVIEENGETQDVIEDELGDGFAENIELQEIEETKKLIEDVIEENGETQDVIEAELVDDIEQLGQQQTAEEIELFQVDDQASLLAEGTDSLEEIRVVPKDAGEDIQSQIIQLKNGVSMVERWCKSIALNLHEVNLLKGLNQDMGTGVAIVVVGLLTFATIVASFVFGSNIRRKRIAAKHSSSTKPVTKEKPSLPLPAETDEPKKAAISNTMPLITSTVPVRSQAPSVELLAEFDVGGISRSSVKSYSSRIKVDDFSEQGFSQLSGVNSNSSDRSISKKKKLGSNDLAGEGRYNEVMTPLRRSTRIRKRLDIVSP